MIAALRRRIANDRGLTVVELLVVMLLMGIVASLVTVWFISTQRSASGYFARVSDQADARIALDRMTKDLRMAIKPSPAVAAFQPTSTGQQVTFYVNVVRGVPQQVRYFTEAVPGGRRLVREVTPPAPGGPPYAWPAAAARRQVLVPQLGSGSLTFRYFAADTAGQRPCATGVPAPCANPLTASPTLTAVDTVGAVEVAISVAGKPQLAPASALTTRVRLANAGQTAIVEVQP